jgi:hypothetical protein
MCYHCRWSTTIYILVQQTVKCRCGILALASWIHNNTIATALVVIVWLYSYLACTQRHSSFIHHNSQWSRSILPNFGGEWWVYQCTRQFSTFWWRFILIRKIDMGYRTSRQNTTRNGLPYCFIRWSNYQWSVFVLNLFYPHRSLCWQPVYEWKDTMDYALSKFVSIPSVSSDPSHREDCRQPFGSRSAWVNWEQILRWWVQFFLADIYTKWQQLMNQ